MVRWSKLASSSSSQLRKFPVLVIMALILNFTCLKSVVPVASWLALLCTAAAAQATLRQQQMIQLYLWLTVSPGAPRNHALPERSLLRKKMRDSSWLERAPLG